MILKNIEIVSDTINITVGKKATPPYIRHTFQDVESANQFIYMNGLQRQLERHYGQHKLYPLQQESGLTRLTPPNWYF